MSQSDTLEGRIIGNYQILRELGRGGMGVVYKAHEQSLQRVVALKILPRHLAEDGEFVRRFVREARAAARLSHPNIVHVYAVGQHQGLYFIAMEYVKGRSLDDVIREEGPLEVRRALDITRQAAEALHEAHKEDIIHRDIKPQNIMIDQAGRVKVMDFGLARAAQASTQLTGEGTKLGTPMYMSPEQCQGREIDERTDIYSLGVTLYEMLAGRPPFEADTPLALMYQITHEPMPAVEELNSEVPRIAAQVIADMTAREPDERYPSTEVLCMHLDAMLRGEAPPPLETIPVPKHKRAPKRNITMERSEGRGWRAQVLRLRPRLPVWRPSPKQVKLTAVTFLVAVVVVFGVVIGKTLLPPPWQVLFNGRNLDGWQTVDDSDGDGEWYVDESGSLTFTGKGKSLATLRNWQDFELHLEYKVGAGGNSGIFLRGRVEIEVQDDASEEKPLWFDGAVAGLSAPMVDASNPVNEWNVLDVTCVGDTITAKLNGLLIHYRVVMAEPTWQALPGTIQEPGPLKLQALARQVWYRNIRIRPITKPLPEETWAEKEVVFADKSLEAAIRESINRPTGVLTRMDLLYLKDLSANDKGIAVLDGLEFCSNLSSLWIRSNQISNIDPLKSLTNLKCVSLDNNDVSNLTPLAGLNKLRDFGVENNSVSLLEPLARLTELRMLWLGGNSIDDISPLSDLINLTNLNLQENAISNVAPLETLSKLEALNLAVNPLGDIEPVSRLNRLESLWCDRCSISDLRPLSDLQRLRILWIHNNNITDLEPVMNLTELVELHVAENPLCEKALLKDIPTLKERGVNVMQ